MSARLRCAQHDLTFEQELKVEAAIELMQGQARWNDRLPPPIWAYCLLWCASLCPEA